jgi:Fe2+ or Zn2+ uptake regulation protein
MQNLNKLLQQTSLKSTPQRLAILKIIDKYGHISIEDIYNKIKNNFPSISLATVYKIINALKDEQILSEIHPQNFKVKFEIKKQPHGHFICKRCNEVYDFELQNVCTPNLDTIEDIEDSEVYLYGICKKCKNNT